jgi:hypothetical protein
VKPSTSSLREQLNGARALLLRWLAFLTVGQLRRRRHFVFAGQRYSYHAHPYNTTWATERTVEVPIALRAVREHPGGDVLEVGNVLRHYVSSDHDVVDKYERGEGVINVDILEYDPGRQYALIVAISTFEHIGYDEEVRDPAKIAPVLARLESLLVPGGVLLATVPLGYNPSLDEALAAGSLPFDERRYLRRISRANRWVEVGPADVAEARYAAPYPWANALAVLTRVAPLQPRAMRFKGEEKPPD